MAGWDNTLFGNLPGPPLPGSPYRPKFPGDAPLFPVDPRAVIGGLYEQGTEGVGSLAAHAARGVGLPDPDLLGHDVTAFLQSPTFGGGMSPMAGAGTLAAAPLVARASRGARTAEEIATGARTADASDAAVQAARAAQSTPGQNALDRLTQPSAPALVTHAYPTSDDIAAIKAAAAAGKDAPWPTAQNPIFDTSPEALARNNQVVPQVSYRDQLPRPEPDTTTLPLKGRAQQIVDAREPLSERIASDLAPLTDPSNPAHRLTQFYSTSPVLEQLVKQGVLAPPRRATCAIRTFCSIGSRRATRCLRRLKGGRPR
jgi:hypothetical protein